MKKIGYLRVSTRAQRPDRQIDGLASFCDELHIERLSASCQRRPVYERVLRRLRPGDALVVWDLDRAFRSTEDALRAIRRLRLRGIVLHVAKLQIDVATPAGYLAYVITSALAEIETLTLSERTREGLAAARRRGVRLGRPPKLSAIQIAAARDRLLREEVTVLALAAELGVARWTLQRSLDRTYDARPQTI